MSSETKNYNDLSSRLDSLSNLAMGLGQAIRGVGVATNSDALLKELVDNLILVTKRITWLERSSDPYWTPLERTKSKESK